MDFKKYLEKTEEDQVASRYIEYLLMLACDNFPQVYGKAIGDLDFKEYIEGKEAEE